MQIVLRRAACTISLFDKVDERSKSTLNKVKDKKGDAPFLIRVISYCYRNLSSGVPYLMVVVQMYSVSLTNRGNSESNPNDNDNSS